MASAKACYVADRDALTGALSVVPEYLRNRRSEAGEVTDYRDWQIPLGRRFRALKLWFVLRSYGAEGLREFLRNHVALAGELATWIEADPRLLLAAPPRLNLVCFRHVDGEAVTQRLLDEVNGSGAAYLTHTRLGGELAVRVCVGQSRTARRHVEELWSRIAAAAR
jgi:aromatic-L-amino-acid decarboxylase